MIGRLQHLTGQWPAANMATLYLDSHSPDYRTISAIHPLLVPSCNAAQAIESPGWLSVSRAPGPVSRWDDGEEHVSYHRFGNDDGFEPLVLVRDFNQLKGLYLEVSEEFRLFHNLYHDRERNAYVKVDDSGQETVVVKVDPRRRVTFRVLELRQYLAIREMHLLVQFDFHESSAYPLAELSLARGEKADHDGQSNWRLLFTELGRVDRVGFARLLGKRLLPPVEKTRSGFPGFAEGTKQYVDFVIGQDDQGREITATCNPAALPRYTGDPEFFTAVSFRKSVLDKYYDQHSKFDVSDGALSCGNLWTLSIDDDHDDWVCAWLGDLGEVLPHAEQLHWRAHNVLVADGRISSTFFDRQFGARFADSQRPEHRFRQLYRQLAETCEQQLGWQILRPLADEDMHRLSSVRVPASAEQSAFDEQVQGLATILVDSLNVRAIRDRLPPAERPKDDRSLDLLEALLGNAAVPGYQPHIDFLRNLQNLRSSGSAHRKGSRYQKSAARVRLPELGTQRVIANFLSHCNDLLRFLLAAVESNRIPP